MKQRLLSTLLVLFFTTSASFSEPGPVAREFCQSQPERCQELREKARQRCDENPEKCQLAKQRVEENQQKAKAWCAANPEQCEEKKATFRQRMLERNNQH